MRVSRYFAAILLVSVLLLPTTVNSSQSEERFVVKGRVVDDAGVVLPGSVVVLLSGESVDGCLVEYHRTDAEARFRIEGTYSALQSSKLVLFALSEYASDAVVPIAPPFSLLRNRSPQFVGVPVSITNRAGEIDVGDIRLQVRYGTVVVAFQDQNGTPLLVDQVRKDGLWLRIRDAYGDVVSEKALSPEELPRVNTGLKIALPEGRWRIEAALEGDASYWHPSESELIIQKTDVPLRGTIKLSYSKPRGHLIYERPESARRRLEALAIPITGKSLIERAEKGNTVAVQLLLSAGIDPDAKGEHGTTALIRAGARGFSEIVSVLLAKGANVDAFEENGATALLSAAGGGNSECVKTLLQYKAKINASTKNGITPLMMAAANDKPSNVDVLLAARCRCETQGWIRANCVNLGDRIRQSSNCPHATARRRDKLGRSSSRVSFLSSSIASSGVIPCLEVIPFTSDATDPRRLCWTRAATVPVTNCFARPSVRSVISLIAAMSAIAGWRASIHAAAVLDNQLDTPARYQRTLGSFVSAEHLLGDVLANVLYKVLELALHAVHLLPHVQNNLDPRKVYPQVTGQV